MTILAATAVYFDVPVISRDRRVRPSKRETASHPVIHGSRFEEVAQPPAHYAGLHKFIGTRRRCA
jgi:hypothetical protein